MPTLKKVDGFRLFFFSNEHLPKHVHIEKGEIFVTIDLETMKIRESYNVSLKELRKVVEIIQKYREEFLRSWDEYFGA